MTTILVRILERAFRTLYPEYGLQTAAHRGNAIYLTAASKRYGVDERTLHRHKWNAFERELAEGRVSRAAEKAVAFQLDPAMVREHVVEVYRDEDTELPLVDLFRHFNVHPDDLQISASSPVRDWFDTYIGRTAEEELAERLLNTEYFPGMELRGARYYFIDMDRLRDNLETPLGSGQSTLTKYTNSGDRSVCGLAWIDNLDANDIRDCVTLRWLSTHEDDR